MLDHPTQEIVLVDKSDTLKDHFNHEGKVIVPKDITVIVEPIPKNKTKEVTESEPPETTQYSMSIEEFESEYNTISAEESYSVANFGNYLMWAGLLAMGGITYRYFPGILRKIGFRKRQNIRVYSDNPELTRTNLARQNIVHEEHDLYSTPKRVYNLRKRGTPHLYTPNKNN